MPRLLVMHEPSLMANMQTWKANEDGGRKRGERLEFNYLWKADAAICFWGLVVSVCVCLLCLCGCVQSLCLFFFGEQTASDCLRSNLLNFFLLSGGIWGGWGRDYPAQRDRGWQGRRRMVVKTEDWVEVQRVYISTGKYVRQQRDCPWWGVSWWTASGCQACRIIRLKKCDKTLSLLPSFSFSYPPSSSSFFQVTFLQPFVYPYFQTSITTTISHTSLLPLSQSEMLIAAYTLGDDCLSD